MQLRKRIFKTTGICLAIILITNINPVHEVVVMLTSGNYFKYSSKQGDCTFMEAMGGRDTAMMNRWFDGYKLATGDNSRYRIFSKNPLAFWRYRDYLYDGRYKLPYKSWGEIEALRGEDFQSKTNWQEF